MDKHRNSMDEFKQSRYNYRFQDEDQWIYFNGVTKKFIPIPSILHDMVETYLESPEKAMHESPSFFASMLDAGLLIKADQDELDVIRAQYNALRNDASYQLMLTLDGGFLPFSQNGHAQGHHTLMQLLPLHLERYIKENNIKHLQLEWIEKSMHPSNYEIIKELSSSALRLCKQEGVELSLRLTLQDGLFEDRLMALLTDLSVQSIRFALKNDFKQSVSSKQAFVDRIRIMMDRFPSLAFVFFAQENEEGSFLTSWIPIFNAKIEKSERQRISFFVRGHELFNSEQESAREKMLFKIHQDGYNLQWNNVLPSLCLTEKKHAFVMNAVGDVAKCLLTLDRTANGYLSSHGNIFWDETMARTDNEIPFFENVRCLLCKHLPICMGQCIPAKRNAKVIVNENDECLLPPWYISPAKVIELYCKQRLDRYLNEGNVDE